MFDLLFSSIKIGDMNVKNRVVMAPLETNFATFEGEINDNVLDFYEERAKGGAGLILTEGSYVDITGKARFYQFSIADDKHIPGLKKLVDIVHKYGSKIVVQLAHAGRQTTFSASGHQPLAPSPIACKCSVCHEVPKELSVSEIKILIEAFGKAARRAKEAGFDAAEIHGAHGYLIHSFLSPHLNKRKDEYGGDIKNRMKFPLEVLSRVKKEVGPDYPLLYRLSAVEFLDDGLKIEDTRLLAKELEKNGINALDVSAGIYESGGICPYMDSPQGHLTKYAKQIKEVVKIPVITVGGINTPGLAEDILRQGISDLVSFGRPFFADPYWPQKASSGNYKEITKCLRCNVCLEKLFYQKSVVCVVNPVLGKESEYQIKPCAKPKNILVIGGGVAGMMASRISALRGHKVTLYEKETKLGGQALLGTKIEHKKEFLSIVESLENQVKKLDINVKLGHKADLNTVKELKPEKIILATGAIPDIPDIPGKDKIQNLTSHEALNDNKKLGKHILVVGGGLVGSETAIFLAEKGKDVTISTRRASRDEIAKDTISSVQHCILNDISKHKIKVVPNVVLKEIQKSRAIFENLAPQTQTKLGTETIIENLESIIFAYGLSPERTLYNSLRKAGYKVEIIGDCYHPRTALEAIHEGFQIAVQI